MVNLRADNFTGLSSALSRFHINSFISFFLSSFLFFIFHTFPILRWWLLPSPFSSLALSIMRFLSPNFVFVFVYINVTVPWLRNSFIQTHLARYREQLGGAVRLGLYTWHPLLLAHSRHRLLHRQTRLTWLGYLLLSTRQESGPQRTIRK